MILVIIISLINRYLVDQKWLRQWKKYTGFDSWDQHSAGTTSAHPGPIDTCNLFKGTKVYSKLVLDNLPCHKFYNRFSFC